MIRFTLKCADDHSFESWFKSADAFDTLQRAGMVSCAICGDARISKAVMAPRILSSARGGDTHPTPEVDAPHSGAPNPHSHLSGPPSAAEQAVRDLRDKIEKTADYVGKDFANAARAMHLGDAPERAIYGEARGDEARALLEEGVPVMPLPFSPSRKNN